MKSLLRHLLGKSGGWSGPSSVISVQKRDGKKGPNSFKRSSFLKKKSLAEFRFLHN